MKNVKVLFNLLVVAVIIGCFFVLGQFSLAQDEDVPANEELVEDVALPDNVIIETGEEMDASLANEAIADAVEDQTVEASDLGVEESIILPDSPWYGLKDLWRGTKLALTFNKVKKAEKRLEIANERLVEAQILVKEKGVEEAGKHLEKVMEKYGKEMEKIDKTLEKIGEKVEDNPRLNDFFDRMANSEIKRQKILQNIEEKMPEELMEKIIEAKEKSAEHFSQVMNNIVSNERITEKLDSMLESQVGSEFKNFKNLEVLKIIADKVPEEAKEAIRQAQENALKRLKDSIDDLDENERALKMKKYLEEIKGDSLRQFEVIDDLKNQLDIPEDVLNEMETMKDQAIKKFEEQFINITKNEIKERILRTFEDGEVENMRIMQQVQNKIDPEMGVEIARVQTVAINAFKEKFAGDEGAQAQAEKFKELTKSMEENPDVVTFQIIKNLEDEMPTDQKSFVYELKEQSAVNFADIAQTQGNYMVKTATNDPEHIIILQEMREFVPVQARLAVENTIREQVNNIENRLENMPDPEDMLDYRKRIGEDVNTNKEILRYKPNFNYEMNATQIIRIGEKIEKFDDPEKMLKYREQFENKIDSAPGLKIQILKSQPGLLKQFDEKQLEVMKEKMNKIEDPEKLVEFREQVDAGFKSIGKIGEKILETQPNYIKEIDGQQIYVVENLIDKIKDPEKVMEIKEKYENRLNSNMELKERIMKNQPDFMQRVENSQIKAIENSIKNINDAEKLQRIEEKVKKIKPGLINNIKIRAEEIKAGGGGARAIESAQPIQNRILPVEKEISKPASGGGGGEIKTSTEATPLKPAQPLREILPEKEINNLNPKPTRLAPSTVEPGEKEEPVSIKEPVKMFSGEIPPTSDESGEVVNKE